MRKLSLAIALVFAIPAHAAIGAYRLPAQDAIKLDGKLDDAAWQQAQLYDTFYEHTPRDNRPAEQRTSMRIAFDDRYFYVALEAIDPKPSEIREPFARRDKVLGDQDFFVFYLDPAGDGKAAQFFRINPRGALADGMFTDTGGEDFSPDYEFDGVAARTPKGWTAELRIPFASLAFNSSNKDWRVMVLRSLTRGDRYRLTSGPAPSETNCFLCYSSVLSDMKPPEQGLNWTITPQLLLSRAETTHADGSKTSKSKTDVTLDMKVRPRADWVVDLTLNPDFSQVELDSPALAGDSKFAVFFPEKRPFFLEGADLLQSPLQAIHSRTVTDPNWGARATWRGNSADATVLTTQDKGGGVVILPGAYGNGTAAQNFKSQATIARGSMRDGAWQYGALFTDRTLEGGRGYNRMVGGDANWQIDNFTRLRSQLLWSETTALPDANGELNKGEAQDDHALYLSGTRQMQDWNVLVEYSDIGRDFRADDGFITQTGIRKVYTELTRKITHDGAWRETNPYLNVDNTTDRDGKTVYRSVRPGLFLSGPYDSFYNFEWRANERTRVSDGGDLLKRDYVRLYADGSPSQWLNRLTATLELGDQIDYGKGTVGRGGYLSLFARIRPHERLEVEQSLDRIWVDGGKVSSARAYTETAYQWNSIWHFSGRDTARLIWQRTVADRADTPSYNNKGNTWSLVYAHKEGLGKAVYVGATLARAHDRDAESRFSHTRQNEVFVKGSWSL